MESNPLANAIEAILLRGTSIQASDMPGLYFVDGRDMTSGQVIDYARQLRKQD